MTPGQLFLQRMLDRLYSTLAAGPLLNCRPHNSRQRICLSELCRLEGPSPNSVLANLLGESGKVRWTLPKAKGKAPAEESDPKRDPMVGLWNKLKTISSDATAYEKETGVEALFVGYPLLCLPPSGAAVSNGVANKRIVAPLAFVPVTLKTTATRPGSVTLESSGEGAELVIANQALLAWAQQITGTRTTDLFEDEAGAEPWREINEIVNTVCDLLHLTRPAAFSADTPLLPVPKPDESGMNQACVVASAVLGLYPLSNQGLLRDLEALVENAPTSGPILGFLDAKAELGKPERAAAERLGQTMDMPSVSQLARARPVSADLPSLDWGTEHVVSEIDPCQRRAVLLARASTGLVLHGPPGTGKSQTITNVIADHLALGQRVLFVCDKRTALDVVAARLRHLGLDHLCAVVHDSRRDQKELYRSLREQLDALDQTELGPDVQSSLQRSERELRQLSQDLAAFASLTTPLGKGEPSFQELLARWLSLELPNELRLPAISNVARSTLEQTAPLIREIVERSATIQYLENPWARGCGLMLSAYLAQSPQTWQAQLQSLATAAQQLDALAGSALVAGGGLEPAAQIRSLQALTQTLAWLLQQSAQTPLAYWANAALDARRRAAQIVFGLLPAATALSARAIDPELAPWIAQQPLPLATELAAWSAALNEYVANCQKWYGGVFAGGQQLARDIVARFGLALSEESARRVLSTLEPLMLRRRLFDWYQSLHGATPICPPDQVMLNALELHRVVFTLLDQVAADPMLAPMVQTVWSMLRDPSRLGSLLSLLQDSSTRLERLLAFEKVIGETPLLGANLAYELRAQARAGQAITARIIALQEWQHTLEFVLRIQEGMAALPPNLSSAVYQLLQQRAAAENALQALEKAILEGQLASYASSNAALSSLDGERLRAGYERIRAILSERQGLSRQQLLNYWLGRQQQRLLAAAGRRLNSVGAELKRRFVSRGEKALRLRQAILAGAAFPDGDPLFDLRPVWMVSPEVAAQIFPRAALFDLIVFDEASQCRLEQALPVLLRGTRVLIAGDPQQLPPTRFFESQTREEEEAELENDQELFEQQQAEVEDLLSAALNLAIDQSYLDVHYRSKNADLVEFSNRHFYGSHLVPLPTSADQSSKEAPIRLIAVDGVYEQRKNVKEAAAVVDLVRQLLDRPTPPTIGIACFNLSQRDTIVEALDDAASADTVFAERLETARTRQGDGASEGLFVKNLENVQGDERDHIIISTTYGPDAKGKFYRRFGPLAQAGGGRRLNVLVTRAREQIHLVTSIPAAIYREPAVLAEDQKPNGGWLLLAYLAFAEALNVKYQGQSDAAASGAAIEAKREPTLLASILARTFVKDGVLVDAPWGNPGLGGDLRLRIPNGRSLVVLCDLPSYARTSNPVEWDLFRDSILGRQGFEVMRLFSPRLLRDFTREVELVRARLRSDA